MRGDEQNTDFPSAHEPTKLSSRRDSESAIFTDISSPTKAFVMFQVHHHHAARFDVHMGSNLIYMTHATFWYKYKFPLHLSLSLPLPLFFPQGQSGGGV